MKEWKEKEKKLHSNRLRHKLTEKKERKKNVKNTTERKN